MSQMLSILIVDDDQNMTKTLVDIINIKGYQAIAASSGIEALEVMRQSEITVVLSDVKMPDMNGVELFLEIKDSYPNIPVILMTAYAQDELIQQGMAEGVQTILTKPLDIEFLLTLLRTYAKM
jgi:DNA-binding NtrC family response regulator